VTPELSPFPHAPGEFERALPFQETPEADQWDSALCLFLDELPSRSTRKALFPLLTAFRRGSVDTLTLVSQI